MTASLGRARSTAIQWLVAGAAFCLPALSLGLPSGYSWGALMLVLAGALALSAGAVSSQGNDRELRVFGVAVALMAAMWLVRLDVDWSAGLQIGDLDRTAKYVLALIAIPALYHVTPPVGWLMWGCWSGAWLAGGTAVWQVYVVEAARGAWHINAIQFGNIALLLGTWSALWLGHAQTRAQVLLASGAVAAGLFASIASGTRGGWIVVPVLMTVVGWRYLPKWLANPSQPRNSPTKHRLKWALVMAFAAGLGLAATQWREVHQRIAEVQQEWALYHEAGVSDSSIGHRLAHWALAWQMGLERPLLGWSDPGYQAEKQRRVDAGEAPASVQQFGHAHQEWLDLWAKAGSLGVGALMLFYGLPAIVYLRALRTVRHMTAGRDRDTLLSAASCGLATVLGFAGFGMTQVMFAHNSGNIIYLFMNLLWLAVVAHHLRAPRDGRAHETM